LDGEKSGVNLGTRSFLEAVPRLSEQIYKIRTILSTGFVENALAQIIATSRKALRGTGFRRVVRAHYDAVQ
jgi:hypothetical protein